MHDTAAHRVIRWALRLIVIGYLFFLVIWPVGLVAVKTFAGGLAPVINALRQPEVIFAFELTLSAAFWAVVINTIFGVGISLLLVRYTFPGRRALNAMVDLPLSVSPVVVGLALGAGLQRPYRLVRPGPGAGWTASHLCTAGDHYGNGIRQPAASDPRSRSGAHRDRNRARTGRPQPRRLRPADLRPDHPARHPVGIDLWGGAESGPIPR